MKPCSNIKILVQKSQMYNKKQNSNFLSENTKKDLFWWGLVWVGGGEGRETSNLKPDLTIAPVRV